VVERTQVSETYSFLGTKIEAYSWGGWEKITEPYPLEKAWFVKDITFEDAIIGDYEK